MIRRQRPILSTLDFKARRSRGHPGVSARAASTATLWSRLVAVFIAICCMCAGVHADVDPSTLTGKVMCGYQGWFATPGDGLGRGWCHWSMDPKQFEPGHCKIDLWPDVSELDADER